MVEPSANLILRGLDSRELGLIRPHLTQVPLETGGVIAEAGQPAAFVYFPLDGVLSLVGVTEGGATVEVAIVGREGVASVSALLGRNLLPFRLMTQVGGKALRAPTDELMKILRDCGQFHERLLVYSESLIFQIGQSAICNRFHNAKQRLARWLLMTIDRAGLRELPLTHEFISAMVGGPRSAVTEAAAELRIAGAIDYRRGMLTVRDLKRLQEEACECYLAVRALFNTDPK
jgi:CRP-like cAMP-binding protein